MSVIDALLRFPQCLAVFDHDEILAELITQLDAKKVTGKGVAAFLGVQPPRITEMKNGGRRIQPHEMARLAEFLGMTDGSKDEALPDPSVAKVTKIWSRIPAARRDHAIDVLRTFADEG